MKDSNNSNTVPHEHIILFFYEKKNPETLSGLYQYRLSADGKSTTEPREMTFIAIIQERFGYLAKNNGNSFNKETISEALLSIAVNTVPDNGGTDNHFEYACIFDVMDIIPNVDNDTSMTLPSSEHQARYEWQKFNTFLEQERKIVYSSLDPISKRLIKLYVTAVTEGELLECLIDGNIAQDTAKECVKAFVKSQQTKQRPVSPPQAFSISPDDDLPSLKTTTPSTKLKTVSPSNPEALYLWDDFFEFLKTKYDAVYICLQPADNGSARAKVTQEDLLAYLANYNIDSEVASDCVKAFVESKPTHQRPVSTSPAASSSWQSPFSSAASPSAFSQPPKTTSPAASSTWQSPFSSAASPSALSQPPQSSSFQQQSPSALDTTSNWGNADLGAQVLWLNTAGGNSTMVQTQPSSSSPTSIPGYLTASKSPLAQKPKELLNMTWKEFSDPTKNDHTDPQIRGYITKIKDAVTEARKTSPSESVADEKNKFFSIGKKESSKTTAPAEPVTIKLTIEDTTTLSKIQKQLVSLADTQNLPTASVVREAALLLDGKSFQYGLLNEAFKEMQKSQTQRQGRDF